MWVPRDKNIFREADEIPDEELQGSLVRLPLEDHRLIYQIVVRGGDLRATTHVLAHLLFKTRDDAQRASADLMEAFRNVRTTDRPDAQLPFTVSAETRINLLPPNIMVMSALCAYIAKSHDGTYDGWEAQLVKTNASMWRARRMRLIIFFRWLTHRDSAGEPEDRHTVYLR